MTTPNLESPTQSTRVDLAESLHWPSRVLWLALVVLAVGGTLLGVPARYEQVRVPCVEGAECGLGRITAEQLTSLARAGYDVDVIVGYLIGLALLMVAMSTVSAFVIYWPRPRSWIAIVASLFLVLVACAATFIPTAWSSQLAAGALLYEVFRALANLSVVCFFLLFPTGSFAPRWSAAVAVAWLGYQLASFAFPEAAWSLYGLPPQQAELPLVLAVLVAGACQLLRHRNHSTPVERQQAKWVMYALVIQAAYFVAAVLVAFVWAPRFDQPHGSYFLQAAIYHGWVITFLCIPAALFISIRRFRLWDIDIIVHRSLVYALLTGVLAAGFGLLLLSVEWLARTVIGEGNRSVAIGIALLGAGALFQPCRQAMRRFVDRRFFGIHVDVHGRVRDTATLPVDGTTVPGYEDLRLIGSGGMARVYQARRLTDGETVAIKVRRWEQSSGEVISRFEREASIIGDLQHPNIVRMFEYCVVGERVQAIVMEYVSDTSLRQRLDATSSLSTDEAMEFLGDVSNALDYAHSHDVVHRDVKPSNVLLSDPNTTRRRAVLTDFGIAKLGGQTRLTVTNPIGTVTHMSPEQIQTPHQVDHRSDIYSLGVLAFQLLTGKVPFGGSDPTAILIAHLQQPAPDPRSHEPNLPAAVAGTIRRALSKNPEDRFETAGDFYLSLVGRGPSEAVTRVH